MKSLECDNNRRITDVLYLDSYAKNRDPTRRLANESY